MESVKFCTEDTKILGAILTKFSSHSELVPCTCVPLIQLILFIAQKSSYSNPNYYINKVFVLTVLYSCPSLNFGALSNCLRCISLFINILQSFPIVFYYISNKMQRYTVYLYLETALHVSGGTSTHHQERMQLYLQHLVFVRPLLLPAAIVYATLHSLFYL